MDDSEVTLNVCLGKQFSGGELFFRGIRCEKHVNTETQPEVSVFKILLAVDQSSIRIICIFSAFLFCYFKRGFIVW